MRLWTKMRERLFGSVESTSDPAVPAAADVTAEPPASEVRPDEPAPGDPGEVAACADPATIAARQERAAGRLLEDERLRGNLTDDEFQPLLDWALAAADRLAAATAGLTDDEAAAVVDDGLQAIREIVGAAGSAIAAHAEGDAVRRSSDLAFVGTRSSSFRTDPHPETYDHPIGDRLAAVDRRLDAEPDLPGTEVATLIVVALSPLTAEQGPADREENGP